MTFCYFCQMKKKIKFFQEHFCVDYETPDRYLLLIEMEDRIPIAAYVVKVPEPFLRCTIYPYIVN
jgi:hypothetical protein